MIEQHEQLDDALEQRMAVMTPEIAALVDLAGEVARSLNAWRLNPAQRAAIQARVMEMVERRSAPVWRRVIGRPRQRAVLGGAALATAAVAAIGVAIARGRRQHQALAA